MISLEQFDHFVLELARLNKLSLAEAEAAAVFIGDTPQTNEQGSVRAEVAGQECWLIMPSVD